MENTPAPWRKSRRWTAWARTERPATDGARPSASRTRQPLGLIWRPAPTSVICGACSRTVTCAPRCAQASAAVSPPIPPPMTVISCPINIPWPPEREKGTPVEAVPYRVTLSRVPGAARSVVAMHLFPALVTFLCLEAHGGDRARIQPLERDGLARHFAIPIFAIRDPAQRRIDLGDQLALAITGPQFQRAIGFLAGAIGNIGDVARSILKARHGAAAFLQQVGSPGQQLAPETFQLAFVHERFVLRGTVIIRQKRFGLHVAPLSGASVELAVWHVVLPGPRRPLKRPGDPCHVPSA